MEVKINPKTFPTFGIVSKVKGRYTDEARGSLKYAITELADFDLADEGYEPEYDYYGNGSDGYTLEEIDGLAERVASIAIYFQEQPWLWIKGTMWTDVKTSLGTHKAYCLMGASDQCRDLIAKVVDFDKSTWKGVSDLRFREFAENSGLVNLNDSDYVDVQTFVMFLNHTAEALREYAAYQRGGSKRTWEKCVLAAFWRQRKTLGLVK